MRLESFKDKKVTRRKMVLISLGVITIIGVSLLLYKTFASFKSEVTFPMMSGQVDYFGNSDVYFAFYNGDEKLDEMPQKGNSENLVFDYADCDNGATIEWNENEWAPLVKNLTQTKTKCTLYFKEYKPGILRTISSSDTKGMWNYKKNITKIVIETKKQEKTAGDGQVVHGPFDESSTNNSAIQSYVVCETGDTNCIGYLQGDGGVKLNSNSSYLFANFTKVTEIEGIENLDTSSVTDMYNMFKNCYALQTLNLSSFDTSSVKDMSYMFYQMSNLQTLTFGANFDTSSVKTMSNMFYECSQLQELDLSSFDTSSVKYMDNMFGYSSQLQSLDVSSFDTSSVKDMSYMFYQMSNLQTLTFGANFDTSSVEDMSAMFQDCSNLQSLDLSHFDTSSVTNMYQMFCNCSQLQELNLSSFNTSLVTDMINMFYGAKKLTKITYGSNFVHNAEADTTCMFYNCQANKPDASVHSSWSDVSFD